MALYRKKVEQVPRPIQFKAALGCFVRGGNSVDNIAVKLYPRWDVWSNPRVLDILNAQVNYLKHAYGAVASMEEVHRGSLTVWCATVEAAKKLRKDFARVNIEGMWLTSRYHDSGEFVRLIRRVNRRTLTGPAAKIYDEIAAGVAKKGEMDWREYRQVKATGDGVYGFPKSYRGWRDEDILSE